MCAADNQKQQKPVCEMLWVNANLATMTQGGYGILENAAVGINGNKIVWIGAMDALDDIANEIAPVTYDARGQWLTPGLIDCHTHLVYAGNRSKEFAMRLGGASYEAISKAGGGIMSTVKATRAISEDELFAVSEKRLHRFLAEGITTMEIKSGYGLDLETELKMLRVAQRLESTYRITISKTFLGAHTVPLEYQSNPDDYITFICDEVLPAIVKERLADAVDAYCEHIAFNNEQIARVFSAAQKAGLKLKIHAEQLSNMQGTQQATAFGILSADHLEYIDEAGVEAMARADTVGVLLPGAFYMLRETQKPPVGLFRKHAVDMAIASDCNPGTSPVLSLLAMMNMACVLFELTAEESLLAVTYNAAKALGMSDIVGSIEVGKQADIAIWDITHPDELSCALGHAPCTGVVYQGQYMTIDERLV